MDGKVSPISYNVHIDSTRGRHLVASRPIQEGELIFQEAPLLIAPHSYGVSIYEPTKSDSTCLGCYRNIQNFYRCSKCGWPVCGIECQEMPDHANNECRIFAESPVSPVVNPSEYEKIKILRLLLLKEKCPEKWEMIRSLESHESARRQNFFAVTSDIALYKFIKQECHLTQFNFDELHHIAGVSSIHSFPANVSHVQSPNWNNRHASLLFYYASLLSHDCSPNTRHTIHLSETGYTILVIATKNIMKGEPVSTCYVDPAIGTLERREILRERYYISCSCARCSDPSEFDTYFSAIKCKNLDCNNGYLLPLRPNDPNSNWRCNKRCNDTLTDASWIVGLLQNIKSELSMLPHSWEALEAALEKYRTAVLHRNHYFIVEMQMEMARLIASNMQNFGGAQKAQLAKKVIELSRNCLAVMGALYPGLNVRRGRLLYYLFEGLIALCLARVNDCVENTDRDIVRKSCKKHFVEALEITKEARQILMMEPAGSADWSKGSLMTTDSPKMQSLMMFFSIKY